MELLTNIIRLFTISQLILLMILLLRSNIPRQAALLTIDFLLGLTGYLVISSEVLDGHWSFHLVLLITVSFPWSFWMLSKVLFDDEFQFRPWMATVVILVIIYNGVISLLFANGLLPINGDIGMSLRLLSFCVSLGFVLLAILEALKNKEADLISDRRNFRNWFTLMTAALMALTVLTEIAFMTSDPPAWLDLLQKTFIFCLLVYFFIRRFEFKPGFYHTHTNDSLPENTSPTPPVDEDLVKRLMLAMEKDQIYHTEGLSIRQLANHLEVKEYILRQTINQHLGFRNFNAFLNDYRINEACTILLHPQQQQLTILEIAFQLGFNSLAPFNKAFKLQTGMTPTEWRKQKK